MFSVSLSRQWHILSLILVAGLLCCALNAKATSEQFQTPGRVTEAESFNPISSEVSRSKKMPHGRLDIKVEWATNESNSNSDVLHGHIEWTPNPNAPLCRNLSMIQIAKVSMADGRDFEWQHSQRDRNKFRIQNVQSGVRPGFFVDISSDKCKKNQSCSPYYIDSFGEETNSEDGYVNSLGAHKVTLHDYPFGWTEFESIELETCVVCRDDGRISGCGMWGAKWNATENRKIFSTEFNTKASPTFIEAMRSFFEFYRGDGR